jgi:hypothetical protein
MEDETMNTKLDGEFFEARRLQCEENAEAAILGNVRLQHLAAAEAWRVLSYRLTAAVLDRELAIRRGPIVVTTARLESCCTGKCRNSATASDR